MFFNNFSIPQRNLAVNGNVGRGNGLHLFTIHVLTEVMLKAI